MTIAILGVDLGKDICSVVGLDEGGAVQLRRRLRRKTLISGPGFQDEEIIPGVEDLQVQLGVDVNDDRNADVFVNPGSVPSGGVVVAARIWLRVRAQDIDVAHVDSQPYVYADRNQAAPNDQVRRLVVMQTIQFRNTRT